MVHCKEVHLLIYLLISGLIVLFLGLAISLCFVFMGFGDGAGASGRGYCLMGCFEVTMVFIVFLGSCTVF